MLLSEQAEPWVYLAWCNLDRRPHAFRTIVSAHQSLLRSLHLLGELVVLLPTVEGSGTWSIFEIEHEALVDSFTAHRFLDGP